MSSISEALVATAVGLLVALPAVAAYNYFQRRIKSTLSRSDTLSRILLAWLKADPGSGSPRKAAFDARSRTRFSPPRRRKGSLELTGRVIVMAQASSGDEDMVTGINVTPWSTWCSFSWSSSW